jgi:hypothetical protein
MASRILGLLGDVPGRLEAVEDVDMREHGDECRPGDPVAAEVEPQWVAGRVGDPFAGEQEAEAMVEAVDGEDDRDAQRAQDLDVHAELSNPAHDLGAGDVQHGLDGEQDQRDHQDRAVFGGVDAGVEPVVAQRDDVADNAGVHGCDRDQQGNAVEPADEPPVAWTNRELAVLVKRSGHRVVARELSEHERDEQHPDHRDRHQPQVCRAPGPNAQGEERVDAHHGREVGESNAEVGEQPSTRFS